MASASGFSGQTMPKNFEEENNSTLRLFYRRRVKEIIAKEKLIKLKSKSDKGLPVFVLPPVEGFIDQFVSLAAEMECLVYGIQATIDIVKFETFNEIATSYIGIIKSIQSSGPYQLIGYSMGTLIGLDIAVQLENCGEKVKLICIDGSPEYIRLCAVKYLNLGRELKNCESDLAQRVMAFFTIQLNYNVTFNEIYWHLEEFARNEDKMSNKMVTLINRPEYTAQNVKDAFYLLYKLLKMGKNFKPTGKLSTSITLIRVSADILPLPEDYEWSLHCNQKINVYKFDDSTHGTILDEKNVKAILKLL